MADSAYSDDLAEEICEAIATSIKGLDAICAERDDFPTARTVHRWLAEHEFFRKLYDLAKERQGSLLVWEGLSIIDDTSGDTRTVGEGEGEREVADHEWIARSRARADYRKWMAARLAPKKWGDKAAVELSGKDGAPLPAASVVMFQLPDNGRSG